MTHHIHPEEVIAARGNVSVDRQLRLRCPQCQTGIGNLGDLESGSDDFLVCHGCGYKLRVADGIVRALTAAREAHFDQFMVEYHVVRAAEGRGSDRSDYYRALPYRDISGANQSQWTIRARTFRYLERIILPDLESRYEAGMDVLDLGAGNGWLSYRLAVRGSRPVAVDLLVNNQDALGAAIHFKSVLPTLFPRFQAELDNLPFEDGQFDVALFNASFHYSESFQQTLAEAIRCLRPGGYIIIADTPWYSREESGERMVMERRTAFKERFGFPSDAIESLEFMTNQRMRDLESQFDLLWQVHSPFYGLRWTLRPLIARLRRHREPSRFRIYVAEVSK
jgi:SAM-dependent methyltransferase